MEAMRTTIAVLALLLGACVGADPMLTCEESTERLFAWQCDVCADTSWCPAGQPHDVSVRRCEDIDPASEIGRRDACAIDCYEALIADGTDVCPPHPSPVAWQADHAACVETCIGE